MKSINHVKMNVDDFSSVVYSTWKVNIYLFIGFLLEMVLFFLLSEKQFLCKDWLTSVFSGRESKSMKVCHSVVPKPTMNKVFADFSKLKTQTRLS